MVARVLFPVLTVGERDHKGRPASFSFIYPRRKVLSFSHRESSPLFYSQPGLIRQHELPMLHYHTPIWIIIDQ